MTINGRNSSEWIVAVTRARPLTLSVNGSVNPVRTHGQPSTRIRPGHIRHHSPRPTRVPCHGPWLAPWSRALMCAAAGEMTRPRRSVRRSELIIISSLTSGHQLLTTSRLGSGPRVPRLAKPALPRSGLRRAAKQPAQPRPGAAAGRTAAPAIRVPNTRRGIRRLEFTAVQAATATFGE